MQERVNERRDWYMHYVLHTFSVARVAPDPFAPSTLMNAVENECSHGNCQGDRHINCDCWK